MKMNYDPRSRRGDEAGAPEPPKSPSSRRGLLGVGLLLAVLATLLPSCATKNPQRQHTSTERMYAPAPAAPLPAIDPATGLRPRSQQPLDEGIAESVRSEAVRGYFKSLPNLAQNEELWIITRNPGAPSTSEDPGTGCLRTHLRGKDMPLPLKHTDVKASVSAYIATVKVRQEFHNPFIEKIEVVYTFPLPESAAVNEFIMTIGDRHIRGIIREREEAEAIYMEARRQGYTASKLTQERPNIFTQSVANIEPSREIDINITYFSTLAYVDGWHEFVFPMVVGPRFNPPYTADGVGAVERGARGASGQATEVQYLRPGERSGHDIALHVDIDAAVKIEEFKCLTHKIKHQTPSNERLTVW